MTRATRLWVVMLLLVGCGGSSTPETPSHCTPYPASDPTGAYASLKGLKGTALKDALLQRVTGHTSVGYDGAKKAMYSTPGLDVHSGKVECVYTAKLYDPSELDSGFNVEHSWPQSEGAEGIAKSDMHHLFPSDPKINSSRGNMSFGETDCGTSKCRINDPSGTQIGPRMGGTEEICEIRAAKRGDIARAHFYFSVRYQLAIPDTEEAVLREWNRCDPPDDQERSRNDAIEKLQAKRNPFVDHPEFVEQIDAF